MTSDLIEITHPGDTLLILKGMNMAPFTRDYLKYADSESSAEYASQDSDDRNSETTTDNALTIKLRLSSAHLAMASSYFQKLQSHEWIESGASEKGYKYTFNDLPEKVGIYRLGAIAAIVDYYKCHGVISFFAQMWIDNMSDPPTELEDGYLPRLLIACVFAEKDVFNSMTDGTIQFISGPIPCPEVSVLARVMEAVNQKREDTIRRILEEVYELFDSLCNDEPKCSVECSAMNLAVVVKVMNEYGILTERPESLPTKARAFT